MKYSKTESNRKMRSNGKNSKILSNRGLSLIELMVVVAISGFLILLISRSMVSYTKNAQSLGDSAKRMTDAKNFGAQFTALVGSATVAAQYEHLHVVSDCAQAPNGNCVRRLMPGGSQLTGVLGAFAAPPQIEFFRDEIADPAVSNERPLPLDATTLDPNSPYYVTWKFTDLQSPALPLFRSKNGGAARIFSAAPPSTGAALDKNSLVLAYDLIDPTRFFYGVFDGTHFFPGDAAGLGVISTGINYGPSMTATDNIAGDPQNHQFAVVGVQDSQFLLQPNGNTLNCTREKLVDAQGVLHPTGACPCTDLANLAPYRLVMKDWTSSGPAGGVSTGNPQSGYTVLDTVCPPLVLARKIGTQTYSVFTGITVN